MAALDEALTAIDAATDEVAAVVAQLRTDIKTGMTPAEVEAAKAKASAIETRLRSIAKNQDEPVPTPEPAFAKARGR